MNGQCARATGKSRCEIDRLQAVCCSRPASASVQEVARTDLGGGLPSTSQLGQLELELRATHHVGRRQYKVVMP